MSYNLNFHYVTNSLTFLLVGLKTSICLTIISVGIGVFGGFLVAIGRLSSIKMISYSIRSYIELFRCTPALVQIIWIFYCVPVIFGWGLEPFQSAILALSLNLIAFNAEAFRASIQAIPLAHHDASVALGLSTYQRIAHVVCPQAFRMAMPVLITNAVGTFQQSALVSIVTIPDLMYNGKMLATQTYRPIETFTTVAVIYFLVTLPFTQAAKLIEDKIASKMGIR